MKKSSDERFNILILNLKFSNEDSNFDQSNKQQAYFASEQPLST